MSPDNPITFNEVTEAARYVGLTDVTTTTSSATWKTDTFMGVPVNKVTVRIEKLEKKYERKCEVCGEKFKSEVEIGLNNQRYNPHKYKIYKTVECDKCKKLDFNTFFRNREKLYREEYI